MEYLGDLLRTLLSFVETWLTILIFDFGRYLIAAGLITMILLQVSRPYRKRRMVRLRQPEEGQSRREFLYSIGATLIFASVGFGVYQGAQHEVFRVYQDTGDDGWPYWLLTLILIIVAHDTYFYWTHRLMHQRKFFAWLHRVHHLSAAPTQWAAYAFAPTEALVQAAFLPLFLIFVPVHVMVLFLWMAHQVLRNALGHCGYELMPRRWLAGWWGRWLTTTIHHDMHHAHGAGNYGLYFTHWDRWCGTERRDYRSRLKQVIDRLDRSQSESATSMRH